jgi:hypothetical protein
VATNPEGLREALAAVRGRWGVHSVVRLEDFRAARTASPAPASARPPWWPTAGPAPASQLLELIGPASGGKLTLALLWLAALPSDGPLALVDAAGAVHPPAAAACGIDLRRLVVVRPPRPRDFLPAVLELTRSDGFDAVLASLDASTPISLAEAGQLRSFAASNQTAVLVLRPTTPLHRPPSRREQEGAGTPLAHHREATLPLVDTRLHIEAHTWLWEDGELAGQRLRVRSERSRLGLAGVAHELVLRLYRRGSHGARTDHLYLDSALRAGRSHARAVVGS